MRTYQRHPPDDDGFGRGFCALLDFGSVNTEGRGAMGAADGLSVSLVRTDEGKAKATVTPVGAPPTYFLRVKVK